MTLYKKKPVILIFVQTDFNTDKSNDSPGSIFFSKKKDR